MLTENQRLPNMLGQRLYNMLDQRFYHMLGQRLYNMLGQRFLDEQSADGFASRNQRWPNENCSLRPNVGPTSTCYLGDEVKFRADIRYNPSAILDCLRTAFGDQESVTILQQKFFECHQKEGETIRQFSYALLEL